MTNNEIQLIVAIITSLSIGSIIGSYLQKRINDKNNSLKHITNERRKWRKRIRELIPQLRDDNNVNVEKIASELQLRLNPEDPKDLYIVNKLKNLSDYSADKNKLKDEIENAVSFLLKHDWERVKIESASFHFNPVRIILFAVNLIVSLYLLKIFISLRLIEKVNYSSEGILNNIIFSIVIVIIFSILYILSNWFYACIEKCDNKFLNWLKRNSGIPTRKGNYIENK
ncbi:MAG: hypothetical protein K9I71_12750 [Ignavibacteriales bacterium]|nr:hypothetical protein [Ignavibacteriales bacterium]MCF8438539.1 hypothetical protein [Ignavibacteriales bacterium]